MLKIALLSPKGPLYRHRTGIFRKDLRLAPLTLTTLASLVPREIESHVSIYDEGVEDIPDELDVDLIGITIITGSANRGYELASFYRSKGITVVLGGPHVTLMPDEAALHADAIVTGYAEETWPQLLRDFTNNTLKSRYMMAKDFSLRDMPVAPFPRRELLRSKAYKSLNTFEATRGCVHKCDFCVVPSAWGSRQFQRPVHYVIDDIKQMKARKLVFYDLNLVADFQYACELFTALIPLKVKWFGLSTSLLVKRPELMDLMAKSGCVGLLIGFESVSPQALTAYNKKFGVISEYINLVKELHSRGIAINGTFMFGGDADDKNSFELVKDFVLHHKIDLPRFSVVTPFPGTPLFERLDKEGRILTKNWDLYDGQHVVFQPRQMSPEELLYGHEKIWKDIYSFKSIWQRTKIRLASFSIVLAANFSYRFYAHNLTRFYNCQGGIV